MELVEVVIWSSSPSIHVRLPRCIEGGLEGEVSSRLTILLSSQLVSCLIAQLARKLVIRCWMQGKIFEAIGQDSGHESCN